MKILLTNIDIRSPKYLVRRRLDLVRKLSDKEIRRIFTREDEYILAGERFFDHPLRDYKALRFYLLLTCFDILGQPSEWIDFSSWLLKKENHERDVLIKSESQEGSLKIAQKLHEKYNEIYGVKNSFYKFINFVISKDRRQELLKSICIRKAGATLEVDDSEKLKFLYKIRNSYTHSGIAMACPGVSISEIEERGCYIDGKLMYGYSIIAYDKDLDYGVRRWPELLFEILEESIADTNFYWKG